MESVLSPFSRIDRFLRRTLVPPQPHLMPNLRLVSCVLVNLHAFICHLFATVVAALLCSYMV